VTLRTQALSIGHENAVLFEDVELTAELASFVCLLGRNGAGKTTLLRTLAGLVQPKSGRIFLDESDLSRFTNRERAKVISVVLTDRPHVAGLSVADVVAMGRQPFTNWFGGMGDEDLVVVRDSLEAVGIEFLANRAFETLSDGERQRVMIARALAQEPRVLLLDEVTAFLDLPGRVAMMSMLRQASRRGKNITILSTHDLDLALQFADQMWVLTDARKIVTGVPEDLARTGVIAECFDSPQAVFSSATGTFEVQRGNDSILVSLQGEGPERIWMERALIRRGFALRNDRASGRCHLSLQSMDGSCVSWVVESDGPSQRCNSIQEVLEMLSRLHESSS